MMAGMTDAAELTDPELEPSADHSIPVTVARGDGIGPEIMDATLRVLEAAGAPLRYDVIEIGEQIVSPGPQFRDRTGGLGHDPA